ncbi:unnamed protein product [Protopolystoma xenopodis]|uniref:Uncharacterized protein n=1 Tax=Protopolystoma xenopodis TaxID=117903 RepID=A0A3S5CTZ7_9PLAT|nr:unnamed protein product [Protopolystoma xenopodis]
MYKQDAISRKRRPMVNPITLPSTAQTAIVSSISSISNPKTAILNVTDGPSQSDSSATTTTFSATKENAVEVDETNEVKPLADKTGVRQNIGLGLGLLDDASTSDEDRDLESDRYVSMHTPLSANLDWAAHVYARGSEFGHTLGPMPSFPGGGLFRIDSNSRTGCTAFEEWTGHSVLTASTDQASVDDGIANSLLASSSSSSHSHSLEQPIFVLGCAFLLFP